VRRGVPKLLVVDESVVALYPIEKEMCAKKRTRAGTRRLGCVAGGRCRWVEGAADVVPEIHRVHLVDKGREENDEKRKDFLSFQYLFFLCIRSCFTKNRIPKWLQLHRKSHLWS